METSEKRLTARVKLNTTAQYIKFFSGPYNLTDKEIVILATMVDTEGELCSTDNRSLSAVALGISKMVLNTYIKRLKDKRALTVKDGKYELARIFIRQDSVEFTILRTS